MTNKMVSRKMLDIEAPQGKVVKDAKKTRLYGEFSRKILTVERKTGDNAKRLTNSHLYTHF